MELMFLTDAGCDQRRERFFYKGFYFYLLQKRRVADKNIFSPSQEIAAGRQSLLQELETKVNKS